VLVALLAAWSPRTQAGAHRRALRTVALLCAATFGVFAIATRRFEGWSHNPRYLFDLVPLFAFALALVVERAGLTWRPLAVGTGAGALLALGPLLRHPTSSFRQLSLLYASLALAFVATVLFVACRWLPRLRRAVAVGLGVLLGWASAVHLGDDVRAARALRGANLDRLITVAALLPDVPAALLAHQPAALAPLLLERDLVIADTNADQGQDAGRLAAELLARGRRVFVLAPGMSKRELRAVVSGHQVRPVADAGALFFELEPRSPLLEFPVP
jgi:hypothetical protein